jgi:hypothetical protein
MTYLALNMRFTRFIHTQNQAHTGTSTHCTLLAHDVVVVSSHREFFLSDA